jgi:hypothetical protein
MKNFPQRLFRLLTTLALALPGNAGFSQPLRSQYDSLYINNINAMFAANGSHFLSPVTLKARFEVPKFSGKNTICASTLWIGGLDPNNNLHIAGQRYGLGPYPQFSSPNKYFDFYVGPVMDSFAYSAHQDTIWNYIWNLRKSDIDYHKAHWSDPGYQPIHDILTWPGDGNVSLGQAAHLAPYYDRNGDGIYNPMDGDYPLIRGDQALYFIFNDDRNLHLETYGNKLKIEIHGMAYAFNLPNDSALKNTVFLNYKIYNRSSNTYHDSYIGVFTDPDIGGSQDDFIGCNVDESYYYGYNGDSIDGTGQSGTYGAHPPAQSVAIIGGAYQDADGIDNPKFDAYGHRLCDESVNGLNFGDSIVDNERLGMTNFMRFTNPFNAQYQYPLSAPQYYNSLKSMWSDTAHLRYGGQGYGWYRNPGEGWYGDACRFMFPGLSDTLNWGVGCTAQNPENWDEITAGSASGDRTGVGSSGPFTFSPGQRQEIDVAYTFARDYVGNGSVTKLANLVGIVEDYFKTNILPNDNSYMGIEKTSGTSMISARFFPNPAQTKINILFDGNVYNPVTIRIYSADGSLVNTMTKTVNSHLITLDVSNVNTGLYLFSIELKGQVITKKVSIIN